MMLSCLVDWTTHPTIQVMNHKQDRVTFCIKGDKIRFVHRLYCFCTFPSLHAVAPKRFWVINKEINGAKRQGKEIHPVCHSFLETTIPCLGLRLMPWNADQIHMAPPTFEYPVPMNEVYEDVVPIQDKILPSIKVPVPIPKYRAHW